MALGRPGGGYAGIHPISQPFSGQCDVTGAGTITLSGLAIFWSAVYLAVEVSSGSPVWTVRDGGLPIVFGSGTQTQLGPFLIPPSKVLKIVLSGASANASVDGQMLGWYANDPSLLPASLPAPASVAISGGTVNATIQGTPSVSISGTPTVQFAAGQSVQITSGSVNIQNAPGTQISTNLPMKQLVQFTAPPNATTTRSVSLDAGAHCLGILVNSITNIASITVSGDQTGVIVPNLIGNFIGQYGTLFLAPRLSPYDTSVTVAVTMSIGAQTATVWVHEVLDVQLVGIFQQTSITTADQRLQQVALDGLTNSLQVSLVAANPAPWQAAKNAPVPFQSTIAAAGTQALVAAVGGKTVYLHHLSIGFTLAATNLVFEDTSGVAVMQIADAATAVPQSFESEFHGAPLPVGRGCQLHNTGANPITCWGQLSYTQQ